MTEAKANGFSDVLFLDSATGKYIEEATACNVFVVKVHQQSYGIANCKLICQKPCGNFIVLNQSCLI